MPGTRPAVLTLQTWAGVLKQPVIVVGETPQRYRITPAGTTPVRLAGRLRHLPPGETALVPKNAVSVTGSACGEAIGLEIG